MFPLPPASQHKSSRCRTDTAPGSGCFPLGPATGTSVLISASYSPKRRGQLIPKKLDNSVLVLSRRVIASHACNLPTEMLLTKAVQGHRQHQGKHFSEIHESNPRQILTSLRKLRQMVEKELIVTKPAPNNHKASEKLNSENEGSAEKTLITTISNKR